MSFRTHRRGGAALAYNENPHAENLYEKEAELFEEEMRRERKSWLRYHMTAIYIIGGILIAVAVFFIIKHYNDSNNPMSRFISASGKDLGSSFSFRVTAEKNGDVMMTYDGMLKTDPSAHTVTAAYNGAYSDYSYTNVIYTKGSKAYKGNLYHNQWVVGDCSEQVNEFFDFYSDYKNGDFDGGSFLRFTKLNRYLNAEEFTEFMDTVRSRLSADSDIAKITTSHDDGDTLYHYDISLKGLLGLIREQGASIFFSSLGYDSFVSLIDANTGNIDKAVCSFDYTINSSGYLSALEISIGTGENTYTVRAFMDHFGSAEPVIPDDFFEAADISP